MKLLIILFSIALFCSLSNASSSSSSSSSSESSSSSSSSESSSSSSSHESSSHSRKVKCSYWLWIGDDVDKEYSIKLKSKPEISFIDVMIQAAAKNNRFKFDHTIHPTYGVLINEICGVANNNNTGQYWTLYDLTSKPDVYNKPCDKLQSTVGVSELKVISHHYYLFWYKTNEGHSQCS